MENPPVKGGEGAEERCGSALSPSAAAQGVMERQNAAAVRQSRARGGRQDGGREEGGGRGPDG